jgi:hypothetical protein
LLVNKTIEAARADQIPVISRLAELCPGSENTEFAPKPLKSPANFAKFGVGCDFFPASPGKTGIYGEPMPGIA